MSASHDLFSGPHSISPEKSPRISCPGWKEEWEKHLWCLLIPTFKFCTLEILRNTRRVTGSKKTQRMVLVVWNHMQNKRHQLTTFAYYFPDTKDVPPKPTIGKIKPKVNLYLLQCILSFLDPILFKTWLFFFYWVFHSYFKVAWYQGVCQSSNYEKD